jgi:cation diffusion facilitator family transporter
VSTKEHDHHHGDDHGHGHRHGGVDAAIASSERGLWALKWSLVVLGLTAALQVVIVIISGSVALLADTVHNVGDALSALPLAVAFVLSRRPPSPRFPFGLHRSEDLAGLAIVGLILFSAVFAAYESIQRLIDPQPINALAAVAIAGVIGFLGNEAVAIFRIRVGREIGSAALIADGKHARVDGLTSLAVVAGAAGVALGAPIADPIVGLLISIVILRIVWDAAQDVGERMLDGIDPAITAHIRSVTTAVPGVLEVSDLRARWLGHIIRAEVNATVSDELSAVEAHEVAVHVVRALREEVAFLDDAMVHVDPVSSTGEHHHEEGLAAAGRVGST